MAMSIVKIVDVSQSPYWLRKIYVTGVNAVAGTGENIAHGLPMIPDMVWVSSTIREITGAEEPTSYIEIEASRTATNLVVKSVGTDADATATINVLAVNFATLAASGIPSEAAIP